MNDLHITNISYIKLNRSAHCRDLFHLDILADPGIVIKISGGEAFIKKIYEEVKNES